MRLSAGRALDFEGVEEILLLVVPWPQVGHSAARTLVNLAVSTGLLMVERSTYPSKSAFTVSANIVQISVVVFSSRVVSVVFGADIARAWFNSSRQVAECWDEALWC
jgi:hypothetical protein